MMPRPPRWDQQVQPLAFSSEGAPEGDTGASIQTTISSECHMSVNFGRSRRASRQS